MQESVLNTKYLKYYFKYFSCLCILNNVNWTYLVFVLKILFISILYFIFIKNTFILKYYQSSTEIN